MNIYISNNTGVPIVKNVTKYFEMTYNNLIDLLLHDISKSCIITDDDNKSNIYIYGIQTTSKTIIDNSKINILLCVENCSIGRSHYKHYNEYKHFNDNRIDIYIYNDISTIIKTDQYLAIPFIYLYIDQFIRIEKTLSIKETCFNNKKFCLFTSRNLLNDNKKNILQLLHTIDNIDHISQYNISNVSCYHSKEILEVFNKYKFIICFENSKSDGYITEKIFNVFLSKSIPIYDGAPNINNYINKNSYISYDDTKIIDKIKLLSSNEKLYNTYINSNKISHLYNNESWTKLLEDYIYN
jgi:hypothetical protein